ncbi:TraB/GumN family protein [Burkholderia ubonensis]
MQRYLDEGNAHVSVGAGHLSGRAGLIRLLEQAGYRSEAMK